MAFYTDDQLLSYFESAMKDVANKKKLNIRQEIKDQYLKELSKIKESLQVKQQLEKSRALREVFVTYQDQINHIGLTYDKQLMDERGKLTASVFDDVLLRLQAFVKTDAYAKAMNERLTGVLDTHKNQEMICHIYTKDQVLATLIKSLKLSHITIQADPRIQVGGFIALFPKLSVEYDFSYDSLLEEQKAWFINQTKLFVKS
jgi:vacuolar-type H+-ATPase subunit E/Vma4